MQDFCFTRKVLGEDFLYEKHVNYLLKSLKRSTGTPLEVAEAHRLSSLFFVVSGLDLLDALETRLSSSDKKDIIEWIYSYQVDIDRVLLAQQQQQILLHDASYSDSQDTFKSTTTTTTTSTDINTTNTTNATTTTTIPISTTNKPNDNNYDDTKVGYSGFRATSMINSDIPLDCGIISMTYCALATLVILGDDLKRIDRKSIVQGMKHLQLPDGSFKPSMLGGECDMRLVYCAAAVCQLLDDWSGLDKDRCAKFIKDSLSYEGAFAQCPGAEAHGGSTYCALASLKLMSKLEDTLTKQEIDRLIRWCINRLDCGFSGRPNKDQDTCYSFWIGACLVILDHFKYIEQSNLLDFILLAQEERGGLSKVPAFYSDPLHTYLGFAGLTFVDDELCAARKIKLLKLEPKLNISLRASLHLDKLHESWRRHSTNKHDDLPQKLTRNNLNEKSNGDAFTEDLL